LVNTCSRNPVTGKKNISFMSEEREIAIGKQNDPSIVASFGLYGNTKIQSFINTKGQQMAKISHRPHLAYEFKVLDSPVVNAFALPGGYVYFTRGILAHFNNEAEFAGVLGHEIGHVTARHGARQYSTKIGYDAHYMADFFQTLSRMQEKSGQVLPEFLSTHPDPGNRNVRVHKLADEEQAKTNRTNLKVNRDSYLRMIDAGKFSSASSDDLTRSEGLLDFYFIARHKYEYC